MPPRFRRWIGIDYSGAAHADAGLDGLRACVLEADDDAAAPREVRPDDGRRWTRRRLAAWLADALAEDVPTVVGLDHGFSFPRAFLDVHGLEDWDAVLDAFVRHWPCDEPDVTVESRRAGNPMLGDHRATPDRVTETWTAGAKSVFLFDVQGSVAKSTHAGLPWIRRLRRDARLAGRVHAWPFDGFAPPAGASVVAEVFPSLVRRRYPRTHRSPDLHDAACVARWLAETDRDGRLDGYLEPELPADARAAARLEGWILGVR